MISANLPAWIVVVPLLAALLCPLVGGPRKTWGLAVLTLTALGMVPLMFAFFVYICWPF